MMPCKCRVDGGARSWGGVLARPLRQFYRFGCLCFKPSLFLKITGVEAFAVRGVNGCIYRSRASLVPRMFVRSSLEELAAPFLRLCSRLRVNGNIDPCKRGNGCGYWLAEVGVRAQALSLQGRASHWAQVSPKSIFYDGWQFQTLPDCESVATIYFERCSAEELFVCSSELFSASSVFAVWLFWWRCRSCCLGTFDSRERFLCCSSCGAVELCGAMIVSNCNPLPCNSGRSELVVSDDEERSPNSKIGVSWWRVVNSIAVAYGELSLLGYCRGYPVGLQANSFISSSWTKTRRLQLGLFYAPTLVTFPCSVWWTHLSFLFFLCVLL